MERASLRRAAATSGSLRAMGATRRDTCMIPPPTMRAGWWIRVGRANTARHRRQRTSPPRRRRRPARFRRRRVRRRSRFCRCSPTRAAIQGWRWHRRGMRNRRCQRRSLRQSASGRELNAGVWSAGGRRIGLGPTARKEDPLKRSHVHTHAPYVFGGHAEHERAPGAGATEPGGQGAHEMTGNALNPVFVVVDGVRVDPLVYRPASHSVTGGFASAAKFIDLTLSPKDARDGGNEPMTSNRCVSASQSINRGSGSARTCVGVQSYRR